MSGEQVLVLAIAGGTLGMFLWGRWRHDMVALAALLACVVSGLVPAEQAFQGFAHPAVITVACVLVLSRGLQTSGAIDALSRALLPARAGTTASLLALMGLAALLSGLMNNVGALALLMPVGVRLAQRLDLPPGKVLMPLAFASILGGTTTLIGTPPNLIVAGFAAEARGVAFAMFEFTPVGLAVTAAGVGFLGLVGWRLVPARPEAAAEGFETGAYLTEARVPEGSKAADQRLRDLERRLDETGAQIVGLVRNEVRLMAPASGRMVRAGDILVIEAEAEGLARALSLLGLVLEEARGGGQEAPEPEPPETRDEVALMELAVLPGSALEDYSASDLMLRTRYGLNLLAVSRHGRRSMTRLRTLALRSGDLLLMQGPPEALLQFASDHGCVPLAERELRLPNRARALQAASILALAMGVAAFGLLPPAVAFAAGVLASMVLRTVPPRAVYQAIDWPVIVLLAGLLPVAGAMQSTGAADLLARFLMTQLVGGSAVLGLVVILVTTMLLTDVLNNAATAAMMAPIAISSAAKLGVNPEGYLMAVAVGASCSFLTPIGHQNNTLILGPGGFRFGDYWRTGLLLEAVVVAVAVPLLLLCWPL